MIPAATPWNLVTIDQDGVPNLQNGEMGHSDYISGEKLQDLVINPPFPNQLHQKWSLQPPSGTWYPLNRYGYQSFRMVERDTLTTFVVKNSQNW